MFTIVELVIMAVMAFAIVDLYTKLEKVEKKLKEKDTTNV